MTTAELNYDKNFSPAKVEAIKAWAAKWNATESVIEVRDVNLEDRNFSEGLIVDEDEAYEYRNKPRTYQTLTRYFVENASKECWREVRAITRME